MKSYEIKNDYGKFTIQEFDNGTYSIYGNIKATRFEFKKIGKMPPNEYGNFYGREKAGFGACKTIINKYYN